METVIDVLIGGTGCENMPSVQQYDQNSRVFVCRLWRANKMHERYVIADGGIVGAVFKCRGAEASDEYETELLDASTVKVAVPGAATQRKGPVEVQLVLHENGGALHGPIMVFEAFRSLKPGERYTEPVLLLEKLIKKTNDAANRVEQMQIDASGLAGDSNKLGGKTPDEYLAADGTAVNAEKLGGKAPEYYIQPRNLLDNSNFKSPVNQRGNTTYYATAMAIDRWELLEGTFAVADGYISTGFVQQEMLLGNLTGVYTLSAKRKDGTLLIYSQEIKSSYGYTETAPAFGAWGDGLVRVTLPAGEYVWAALYEGEYTAETLPPYVPKNYAEELAACQRYFVRIGGNAAYTHIGIAHAQNETQLVCSVHLPQPMREGVLPSVIKGGDLNMTAKAGSVFKDISAVSVNQVGVGAMLLTLTSKELTKGDVFDVYVPSGSWLDISTDL